MARLVASDERQGSGTSMRASSSRPDPEEVRDRDGMAERDERRVDAVLQGRPVAHEVEAEASPLPLGADRGGQPDLGHQVPSGQLGEDPGIDLVGLGGQRCQPLTLTASPMATSQPRSSSWSWTKRAPVIDSMTAVTSWPCRRTWAASVRRASASGRTAITSTVVPLLIEDVDIESLAR